MKKQTFVWRGPVIGTNLQGYPSPVFYDLHTSINSGQGSSTPGVLITGAPGSGKSFAGMTLAMMSAVSGKKTIFVDPKNDARGMAGLMDWLDGKITVVDINDRSLTGAFDPFVAHPERTMKVSKAWNLISILLGPFTDEQEATLYPIVQDVADLPNASMKTLQLKLNRHPQPFMNKLGTQLEAIKGSSSASGILFADTDTDTEIKPITLNDGLTIIGMMGLKLPSQSKPESSYTAQEKLSIGVMYLITDFLLDAMKNEDTKNFPKSIFIDEAWALTSTRSGYDTISDIIRLGRSMNTACVLMTQNASDIKDYNDSGTSDEAKLNSQISTRFAFKCGDNSEAVKLCEAMSLDSDFADRFTNLSTGQCVMKDYKGRIARIQFNLPNPEWARAFETNPQKRAEIEREKQQRLMEGTAY